MALVGPVAPPRGGVASHVERLAVLLKQEGQSVAILNHFAGRSHPLVRTSLNRNPLRYWIAMRRLRARVVHYHHARLSTLIAAALARRHDDQHWIVTFHGGDILGPLSSRVPVVSRLTVRAIRRFDRVVAVNEEIARRVTAVTGLPVTAIPAYLPTDRNPKRPVESPTAVVSAYSVAHTHRSDTYGLDIAGAVCREVRHALPQLRLEVFLSQRPKGRRAREYLREALGSDHGAHGSEWITIHVGSPLVPAFQPGVVYLRPTRTEGDAVSVREALEAGVPVIASNVVKRPDGVIALPLDDTAAWTMTVQRLLGAEPTENRDRAGSAEVGAALLALYRELAPSSDR